MALLPKCPLHLAIKNIHTQCARCNGHLGSNAINYRLGLIERYGEQFVEDLEADKAPRQFNTDEIIAIGAYYKRMIKLLTP